MALISQTQKIVGIFTIVLIGLDSRKNPVEAICTLMPKLVYVIGPQWSEE